MRDSNSQGVAAGSFRDCCNTVMRIFRNIATDLT
jgi:hypothetical protein